MENDILPQRLLARLTDALVALLGLLCARPAVAQTTPVQPFSLETGEFSVAYEPAAGTITIRHLERPAALATRLAAGALFDVTSPEFVKAVRVSRERDVTRARIVAEREWASFRGLVEVYPRTPGLVRLRLDATTKQATRIADSPPELRFVDARTRGGTPGTPDVYKQQAGIEAPVVYLHHEGFGASLLYFQDLTSLNPYLDQVQGDPRHTVRADTSGIGFRRPQGMVPAGFSFTVTDAYLWLSPDRPVDHLAQSKQFLRAISDIYDRLSKPATEYTDWLAIARSTARGLLEPINGVEVAGTRLLKAYVGEAERQVEAIVNFDVLVPAKKYVRLFGADENTAQLISDIERGLRYWFVEVVEGKRTVADVPRPPHAVDAWYYVYPIVQTADLALLGNADAKEMLLGSVPKLLELGRAFDYEFPFRLDPVTNTRADDRFREFDVLGGYAYVMLTAHQLTGNALYLDEAKRAVEHVRGKGFGFTYELQMTGVTLVALAWLYEITGDERYVELATVPLANIFALTWLWEPDYGYAKSYTLFMGTNPLPGADQVAAFELHNTWWSLQSFYQRTEEALPPYQRKLIAELLKHQLTVGRYTLPRFLPREALSRDPDWGTIRPELDIPVEDLKDGFHKSAMVGQEIYGSGITFRFAGEAYRVLGDAGEVVLFAEYPITGASWSDSAQMLDFRLGGTPEYRSRVRVYFRGDHARDASSAQVSEGIEVARGSDYIEFFVPGGRRYQVRVPAAVLGRPVHVLVQGQGDGAPPPPSSPLARVAGILGAGGTVQVEVGGTLSVPLVVAHPRSSPVEVSFEADLPAGWRLQQPPVPVSPGAEVEHMLRIVPGSNMQVNGTYPVAIRMRSGGITSVILQTLVRGIAQTDQEVGESHREFNVSGANGKVSVQDGMGVFSTTQDGAAAFTTRPLTVDIDRRPYLDFHVDSLAGTWAVKVYEQGASRWGVYILPQIPVIPESPTTGWFRIQLPERTGWSGIHSFRVELFVVGPKGSTLRLRAWRLVEREES
jgi:hypothetical protein